ncbi:Transcriptional regulator, AraC family [Vulgatibacter incomptus]|uniref:Transcriptional regulator, AraC family n=1 Tax=Vulgatibacter incomptus TaxID=1391653 RepID=A0A0K1P8G8_9BACT|nr:Transcriptional regulator, AraC family [Vulgatibacter incomptus]
MLPTGSMHLAVRLSGPPLRVFRHPGDREGQTIGHAVIGGARTAPYLRDVSEPVASVGIVFHPGAAPAVLGVPADELSGRHTSLEDLWGLEARFFHERLAEEMDAERRLELLEELLLSRRPGAPSQAIARAVERLERGDPVSAAIEESGFSHRHFLETFRRTVGLTPKRYGRVARFQRAVDSLFTRPRPSLAELAVEAGYADQPHLTRDFVELAGITPGRYGALSPASPNHVPEVNSVQDPPVAPGQFVRTP